MSPDTKYVILQSKFSENTYNSKNTHIDKDNSITIKTLVGRQHHQKKFQMLIQQVT